MEIINELMVWRANKGADSLYLFDKVDLAIQYMKIIPCIITKGH